MLIVPAIAEQAVASQEHGDSSRSPLLHVDVFGTVTAPGCWERKGRDKSGAGLGNSLFPCNFTKLKCYFLFDLFYSFSYSLFLLPEGIDGMLG